MKINASEVSTYFVIRDFGLNNDVLRVTDALDAEAGMSWAGLVMILGQQIYEMIN